MNEMLRPDDTIERCGVVMSDGTFVEIENIAEEPEKGFEIRPDTLVGLLQTGEVVSTWHTHPHSAPNLSGEDYSCFLAWPDLTHIIFGRHRGHPRGKVKRVEYRVENGMVLACN